MRAQHRWGTWATGLSLGILATLLVMSWGPAGLRDPNLTRTYENDTWVRVKIVGGMLLFALVAMYLVWHLVLALGFAPMASVRSTSKGAVVATPFGRLGVRKRRLVLTQSLGAVTVKVVPHRRAFIQPRPMSVIVRQAGRGMEVRTYGLLDVPSANRFLDELRGLGLVLAVEDPAHMLDGVPGAP